MIKLNQEPLAMALHSPCVGLRRSAFTLVEMMIVVAVITILIGLLMPAIQSVRESARLGQCRNNVRQMALACLQHEASQGFFPMATKWYGFTADADLGNGKTTVVTPDYPAGEIQTGSWQYNILPFMDYLQVHQYGLGTSGLTKRQWNSRMVGVVIPTYACASRTDSRISMGGAYTGADPATWPGYVQRSDFNYSRGAPDGIGIGMRLTYDVTDGLSNVFLLGHRFLNPLEYNGPGIACNNGGWTQGRDWDHMGYTGSNNPLLGDVALNLPPGQNYNPRRDTVVVSSCGILPAQPWTWSYPTGTRFGSPHAVLPMAMADGSVQSIDYLISKSIFHTLGNVADGGVLPPAP